jgi:hypothetical protein
MPASDVTVSAEFEALYSINTGSLTNGVVSADETSAVAGTVITLTVTPEAGYALKAGSLKYNDGSADHVIDESGPTYSFTMPASDVTVSAVFNPVLGAITIEGPRDEAVTVKAEHSAGHTPFMTISRRAGESVTFTLDSSEYTAEAGNLMWLVEGRSRAGTGNSLVINAGDYVERSYSLIVMIKVNNQWYSAETGFKVVE